jgi:hypothetical protein
MKNRYNFLRSYFTPEQIATFNYNLVAEKLGLDRVPITTKGKLAALTAFIKLN